MTTRVSAENAIDRAAKAIQEIRLHTDVVQRLGEDITEQFDRLEASLRVIRTTDNSKELEAIANRVSRLRELKNMMELGSFQIQVHREIGEAWRRLP